MRQWAISCGTSVAVLSAAFSQWPHGGTTGQSPQHYAQMDEGCAVNPSKIPAFLSEIRYTVIASTEHKDFEIFRGLQNSDVVIGKAFGVEPTYGVYDDDVPNAFATPTDIAEMGDSDGTVLIGRRLIAAEQRANRRLWGAALTFVFAHEYAHILQFKRGLAVSLPHSELHADYLAGWWLGRENASGSPNYTNLTAVWSSLLAKGDYKFNSAQSHGTVAQRLKAVRAGVADGARRLSLNLAYEKGLEKAATIAAKS